MSMHAMKTEATAVAIPVTSPTTAAPVVTMTPKAAPRAEKYIKMARETAVRVVPPLIVIALLMLFWELVCRRAGSTLPPRDTTTLPVSGLAPASTPALSTMTDAVPVTEPERFSTLSRPPGSIW